MGDNYLYELLGVSRTAGDSEIKKAYHKLAKQYHPDKNKDHGDKFKEISFAYEILSDSQKRQTYDRFGLEGLKEGAGSGSGFGSIFDELFPGMFPGMGGGRRARNKGQSSVYPLKASLEELYKGKTAKLKLRKMVLCHKCNGQGGKAGAMQTCQSCRGNGIKVTVQQLAPGFIQQMQSTCSDCQGEGRVINERDRCKTCKGQRTVEEEVVREVSIAPGSYQGLKVVLYNEGNQEPGMEPGDVIVVVQQQEHDIFKREANDLYMEMSINLTEALCGFKRPVKHVSGHTVVVTSAPGNVVSPGSMHIIRHEGMPYYKDTSSKGHLIIKFKVEFPENYFAAESALQKIARFLPKPDDVIIPPPGENVMDVSMMPIETTKGEGTGGDGRKEAYDSEEDEEGGGGRVPCHVS